MREEEMKKKATSSRITGIELLALVSLLLIGMYCTLSTSRVISRDWQSGQLNNCKQLLTAVAVFAQEHGGRYPNGRFDLENGAYVEGEPLDSAEKCFQDLIDAEILGLEALLWSEKNRKQCNPKKPNENGIVEPGENSWDYIAGLNTDNESYPNFTTPLIFQASDFGNGKTWTRKGGHPWAENLVVGYSDGSSARKEGFDDNGRVRVNRDGNKVDLCVPTPGKNSWPETARIAPATPFE